MNSQTLVSILVLCLTPHENLGRKIPENEDNDGRSFEEQRQANRNNENRLREEMAELDTAIGRLRVEMGSVYAEISTPIHTPPPEFDVSDDEACFAGVSGGNVNYDKWQFNYAHCICF